MQDVPLGISHEALAKRALPRSVVPSEEALLYARFKYFNTMLTNDELLTHAVQWFKELLAIDTSNPPGGEHRAIAWLAAKLQAYGISSTILAKESGRENLIAEVAGSSEATPLILSSHVDVVPVEENQKWKVPPFSGAEQDGCIWGRGALDMKYKTIFDLIALIRAAQRGTPRTLTLVALADEEAGGERGIQYLLSHHRAILKGDLVLNEVGGFVLWIAGTPFVLLQTGEKGVGHISIKITGAASHASMPCKGNVIDALVSTLSHIRALSEDYYLSPSTEVFLSTLAEKIPSPLADGMLGLKRKESAQRILQMIPDPVLAGQLCAMLYRTVVPTEIHSGFKSNVIPSEARIGIDVRTHAHEGIDGIVSELTRRMNLGGAATISVDMYTKGYEIPVHREEIKTLRTTILNEWSNVLPTLTVTPYLLPASSDSSHYAEAGITPIGFAPLLFPIDFPGFSLAHGVDERVPKSSFENGLLLYLIALDSLSESR